MTSILCLHKIVAEEHTGARGAARTARDTVEATAAQIEKTTVGNLHHRIWNGECLKDERCQLAPAADLHIARLCNTTGHPAWERALVPRPPLPRRRQSPAETFTWHVKPATVPVNGRVYSDGSWRDAKFHELPRGGWAFVIIDANCNTMAAAYGVPPPWIEGIEGVEAWGHTRACSTRSRTQACIGRTASL